MLKNYTKALEELDECLKNNPKNIPELTVRCYTLLKMGQFQEVTKVFEQLPSEIVVKEDELGIKSIGYALQNDKVNTEKNFKQLLKLAEKPEGFRANSYLIFMYVLTGQIDKTYEWIDEAIENNSFLLLIHFADPMLVLLKDDRRYSSYQKKIFPSFTPTKLAKKKKVLLDEKTVLEFSNRLSKFINEEKPYLDPSLSLRTLADQIKIHPNQLSWLLNESIGENFNEYINHLRVDFFKKIALDKTKSHITLIGLAFESGFNSKTVFNTYFKKFTGLTPKQFLKEPS